MNLTECAFITVAAWRSLYVSFTHKHALFICTLLLRPKAMHISGVHCNWPANWLIV